MIAWLSIAGVAVGQTWRDADQDGYGDPNRLVGALHPLAVGNDLDCDDTQASVLPGALEVCDRIDNDCNGLLDDDDPGVDLTDARMFYLDADLDSIGTASTVLLACALPPGFSPQGDDCDDLDRTRHPRARELCDGIDNDCDGAIDDDDDDAQDPYRTRHYWDGDGDGYGDPEVALAVCTDPTPGWVDNAEDCDDTDPLASPDDHDGDTFGVCAGDCDDTDPVFSPDASEICDDLDTDCDAHPDSATAAGDQTALGCDLCPRVEDLDGNTLELTVLDPCVLDPTSGHGCTPGAEQFHTVAVRTDLTAYREPLFLFLGDDPAAQYGSWLEWAAHAGYKAVQLGWPNEVLPRDCPDELALCVANTRSEAVTGVHASWALNIGPQDSIEGRLATLLADREAQDPGRGWTSHLDGGGQVDWSTVVVAGFGGAAGHAGWIAQRQPVHAAILLSGPPLDGWEPVPWATAPCRIWALYHKTEVGGVGEPDAATYESVVRDLGVVGTTTLANGTPYPWSSHVLILQGLNTSIDPHCTGSRGVADDDCIDTSSAPAAISDLLCLAAEPDATCP